MSRLNDLVRFYELLRDLEDHLGGCRHLRDCDGRMGWPDRGVYLFFEPGEQRTTSGVGPRIARVGTHALTATSKTTLWNRLAQHRGTSSGSGNHRGSIFRLLVGRALIKRDRLKCSTWGLGSSIGAAARKSGVPREQVKVQEQPIEQAVSSYIGNMPFLWLSIDDAPGGDSMRGIIERNSIALLGNHSDGECDPASASWLGHDSDRQRVRTSGLWNQNHVDESYDRGFLDLLKRLIAG